jgi:RNA-directed DNA polymerase
VLAAVDRLVCQAIAQVRAPLFDPQFHPQNFGFRPGVRSIGLRSGHDSSSCWCGVVRRFDLDSFFDRIQHDAPMARVARPGGVGGPV